MHTLTTEVSSRKLERSTFYEVGESLLQKRIRESGSWTFSSLHESNVLRDSVTGLSRKLHAFQVSLPASFPSGDVPNGILRHCTLKEMNDI